MTNKEMEFTHFDTSGRAHMVDVSQKDKTIRRAKARAIIHMSPLVIDKIRNHEIGKGDVLSVAQVAGIMAAKKTSDLIPMCHPLMLTGVEISFEVKEDLIIIESIVKTEHKTGVEMEALTAASVTALTIYDMCKAFGQEMSIDQVCLVEKTGGKRDMRRYRDKLLPIRGRVVSANISSKKGVVKKPVDVIYCQVNQGVEGDAHKGYGRRQISLLDMESIHKVEKELDGSLPYGSFAENLTTEGLVLYQIPVGTLVRIGNTLHRVSQIGKTCHKGCEIAQKTGKCVMPLEGIFTQVVQGGEIHPGDPIEVLDETMEELMEGAEE